MRKVVMVKKMEERWRRGEGEKTERYGNR